MTALLIFARAFRRAISAMLAPPEPLPYSRSRALRALVECGEPLRPPAGYRVRADTRTGIEKMEGA